MSFLIKFFKSIFYKMLELISSKNNDTSSSLSVYVKIGSDNALHLEIDPVWNIKKIKEIIAPQIGLMPDEIKIIFAGRELANNVSIDECDLGQQSILHAVKIKARKKSTVEEQEKKIVKTLFENLSDNLLTDVTTYEKSTLDGLKPENHIKRHFYVFCATCKSLKPGKIRVRCHFCKSGAFTVHADPQNWADVLEPKKLTGDCNNDPDICTNVLNNSEPNFAEFYFKCAEHISLGETDEAVPLYLIKPNLQHNECIACLDVSEIVFAFPCTEDHILCLSCFQEYCTTRLKERQFFQHSEYGYTLSCPMGCPKSFIKEVHHFRLLSDDEYQQYHRFAAEEFVLQTGGILCPQPGCGMGILPDPECSRITCINGCGFVFCRKCLQGYHIGECESSETVLETGADIYTAISVNPCIRVDDASKVTIRVSTKPCPNCKTPTERDGGCMHMVCTRRGCEFNWCWVCQTEWTRDCMANHWFG